MCSQLSQNCRRSLRGRHPFSHGRKYFFRVRIYPNLWIAHLPIVSRRGRNSLPIVGCLSSLLRFAPHLHLSWPSSFFCDLYAPARWGALETIVRFVFFPRLRS